MPHWYTRDGHPRHNADMKQVRTEKLRPGVTDVLNVMAKPGLEMWKQNQILDAAARCPRQEGEVIAGYKSRLRDEADSKSFKARGFGSSIHHYLEQHFKGATPDNPDLDKWVRPLIDRWEQKGVKVIESEKVIVNNEVGFGGTCDGIIQAKSGWVGVIDFKTASKSSPSQMGAYLEHKLQLAAYAGTMFDSLELTKIKLVNIFISSIEPGVYKVVMHDEPAGHLYNKFLLVHELWCLINKYNP